jgi:hypothetical protein
MSWAKIDDQFYLNQKNDTITRDEQDLYLAGLVYCNGQLTDGFIPAGKLALLFVWAKLPIEANAQALASGLVKQNYWEFAEGGYMVHDFLDWNMSKEEIIALKSERTEAGRRGGVASAAKRQANARASVQAKPKQNSTQSPSPSPILCLEENINNNGSDLSKMSSFVANLCKVQEFSGGTEAWYGGLKALKSMGATEQDITHGFLALKSNKRKNYTVVGPQSLVTAVSNVMQMEAVNAPHEKELIKVDFGDGIEERTV